jgi:putative transcriptional regulator
MAAQQPFLRPFMAREAENPYPFKTPLVKLRKAIGLTTVELGLMVGMNNGWISRLESGLSRPSYQAAEKLALLFRGEITEMHLIYPERYKDWEPTEDTLLNLQDMVKFKRTAEGFVARESASESHSNPVSAS